MSRTKEIKFGIHKKALIGIIVFTLLTNTLMCLGGSFIFDRAIHKIYNERGYMIAQIILDELDTDKIAEYARTWKEDAYYYSMAEFLLYIQERSDSAYIYIGVPSEDKTIKYIYDSGSYMGFVDSIAAPFDVIWQAYTEGVKPKSDLARHSQYGHLTSSCLPVKDSSGNIVALLFVDTDMEIIDTTLYRYVCNMTIIALILLAAFCVLNWYFFRKNLIDPLMIIRKNVRNFAINTSLDENTLKSIQTHDELEDLSISVMKMEKDIIESIENIKTITAEKERISVELNVATKIQADMLPRIFPPFPDRKEFDIYATMNPAKEVGGDFYDFFLIDDDHIALVMADVSGKGVPAALFMVIAKTLIKNRATMNNCYSPAQILYDVNNQLCEGNEEYLFVTVWLAIIQISTGDGIAANAGHENPAIKRRNGKFEFVIYKHSPVVAAMKGMVFEEHKFKLNHGDSLFVYTDGVTEASNSDDELYGDNRLLEALNINPEADANELLENVTEDVQKFVKDAPQFDDITMLGFRYL